MNLLRWFNGADDLMDVSHDTRWAWVTLGLSALLAAGYGVIAINWYFQAKLSRFAEARAALTRLRNLCICCALCGGTFYALDLRWAIWRIYDLVLLVLVFRTWLFVSKMRGLSLVNERLAQLKELETSAARYREIAELLPHMVWTADSEGFVDFSNQRWREYVGDNRTWLDALHPEDYTQAFACWSKAVASRRPLAIEARLGGPQAYRAFVVKATPIVKGDVVKWLGACADIEDQKLLATQKELQAKQRGFFLNALSHDLRAPLNNIVLNAHLLTLGVHEPAEMESIEMIRENALAAADLVTKLLDFAKVGAQDHNCMENVPLAPILRQLERRFAPIAEQKGLHLRLVDDGDATVWTDRQKLERVVSNLVDNAIKYTTRGGITLEVQTTNSEISIRISDTGIGIPQDNVPHLFDEFYQVNNYERDRSKGFGMGLAICKSLAQHIGADVRLASTGPDGSCFEIILKAVCPDRGGRLVGAAGDLENTSEAGLCRV